MTFEEITQHNTKIEERVAQIENKITDLNKEIDELIASKLLS